MAQQTTDNEKNIEDVFQELDVIAEKLKAVTLHWKTLFVYTKKEWSF